MFKKLRGILVCVAISIIMNMLVLGCGTFVDMVNNIGTEKDSPFYIIKYDNCSIYEYIDKETGVHYFLSGGKLELRVNKDGTPYTTG